MDKKTNKRKEYITNPARIVSFCVFIFGLGVTYATINNRIERLEEFRNEVNIVEIQKDLQEIKVNISRIQKTLNDYIK